MSEFQALSGLLVESIGWTLLHFLWQGALLAALFAVVRIALHRAQPRLRLWAGHAALLALAAAPLLTFAHFLRSGVAALDPAAGTALPSASAMASTAGAMLAADAAPSWPALVQAALPWLVALWMAGVLVQSVRGLRQWRALRALCDSALPAQLHWQQRLQALSARMGIRQLVQLRESALVTAPMLVGWLKPVILLPACLCTRLPAEQVELLLAHELAHVRRLDYLANLLQMALETVLFYHPAVHWISRCVRDDREQCCDDLVTGHGANRLSYARALLSLAEHHAAHPRGVALAANGGVLLERIERIVDAPRSTAPAAATTPLLVLAGAVALAAVAVRTFAPAPSSDSQPLAAALPSLASAIAPGQDALQWALPAARIVVADLAQGLSQRPLALLPAAPAAVAPTGAALPAPPPAAASPSAPAPVPLDRAPLALSAGAVPATAAVADVAASDAAAPALPMLAAAAQPAAPAAAAAPAPLTARAPEYPRAARRAGIEGWVRLSYVVQADGSVTDIDVVDAAPSRIFSAAARKALAGWRFPAASAGAARPEHTRLEQTFTFVLEGRSPGDIAHCNVATGSHLCREGRLED